MFINDLVLKLQTVYDIYNYADANTGGVSGKSAQEKELSTGYVTVVH